MRDIQYSERFQYGQLAHALSSLGFSEHIGANEFGIPFRAFYNRTYDALITLPQLTDDTLLEPVHLRIAEKAVENRGVADSKTLFRLLHEASRAQVA
jgi:hypothetical protein